MREGMAEDCNLNLLATANGIRVVGGDTDELQAQDFFLSVNGNLLRGTPDSVGAQFKELLHVEASLASVRRMPAPWVFSGCRSLDVGERTRTSWWNEGEVQSAAASSFRTKRGDHSGVIREKKFGFVRDVTADAGASTVAAELFFVLDHVQGMAGLLLHPGDVVRGVRELDKKGRVRAGRLVVVNLGS